MNTMKETLARLRDRIRETQESIKELDMVLMLDSVYLSDKEEIRILDGVMKDNHAIGGLITVMTQIIQTAATEILPTEMSIHDRISRKMDIAPGVIVKFPYVQLNAPGGLFYANIQDLKATSFGSDEEVTAQMENVGIKLDYSSQETGL